MHRRHVLWFAGLFAVLGCGEGGAPDEVVLEGRVFAADTQKPVANSTVAVAGGREAKTAADGSFKVRYATKSGGSVQVKSKGAAPVSKAAPKKGGYIELHVKQYDAQKQIDASAGGAAEAKSGARLATKKDALVFEAGTSAKRPTLAVAAPDPKKLQDLSAIPGDFDAKKGARAGKLSTRSPVYVTASEGDERVKLKKGARATVDLPARGNSKALGETASLYQFDEAQMVWVERGSVQEMLNEAGIPVYRAEVEALGWWAVGDFYDELSCLRGCVHDAEGKPVESARVLAIGVDYFGQTSVYTGTDGCYTLDVRASSALSVSAQVAGAFAAPVSVMSGRSGEDSACVEVPLLRLVAAEGDGCPLGLVACGDRCVESGTEGEECAGEGADAGPGGADAGPGVDDAGPGVDDAGVGNEDAGPDPILVYPLSIVTGGPGTGVVLSTPEGISCGDLCSHAFPAGTEVTLHAQPDEGYSFAGWGGECGGAEATCTLTMDGPRAVTASFGLMGQLNVFASGTGIVNAFLQDSKIIDCSGESSGPDCSEVVPLGTNIELIVSTPVNMAVSWGGACSGQELSCQVSITEVTDVYVTFTPIQYTLTVIISGASNPGPGRGSILLSTPPEAECVYANDGPPLVTCPFTYDPGTVVTLTAVPYAPLDSFFDKWGGACDGVAAAAPCTLTINGDTTVTGAFGYVIQ